MARPTMQDWGPAPGLRPCTAYPRPLDVAVASPLQALLPPSPPQPAIPLRSLQLNLSDLLNVLGPLLAQNTSLLNLASQSGNLLNLAGQTGNLLNLAGNSSSLLGLLGGGGLLGRRLRMA